MSDLTVRPMEVIRKGIAEAGIPPGDFLFQDRIPVTGGETLAESCGEYLEELALFNKAFGLVSCETDTENGKTETAVRHILDSLAPWKILAEKLCSCFPERSFSSDRLCIADAGSGAGLPGIPLALLFPGMDFFLIERMEKRCAFLQNCKAALGIKNLAIVNNEIEKAEKASFDMVVFRAFRPLEKKILNALLNLLKPAASGNRSGFLAAYKGKAASIKEEVKKMGEEGFRGKTCVMETPVPFLNEERHVVFISA